MKLTDKIKEFGYSMKSHAGKIIVGGIILAETVLIGLQQDEKYRLEQEFNSYKNEMRSKSEYVIDAIKPIRSIRGGDVELLVKAKKHGFKIKEVGVRHFPRHKGKSEAATFFNLIKPKIVYLIIKEAIELRKEITNI